MEYTYYPVTEINGEEYIAMVHLLNNWYLWDMSENITKVSSTFAEAWIEEFGKDCAVHDEMDEDTLTWFLEFAG